MLLLTCSCPKPWWRPVYCLPGTIGNVLSQVFKVVVPCGEFVQDYIELIVIMYEEASFGPEKHN